MIVACVRTGTKYGVDYVERLKAGVARHLAVPHDFVCLTDRPDDLPSMWTVDIRWTRLQGWWGKMALFQFSSHVDERVIYLDLDTVVTGSLDLLASIDCEFGICRNFTRDAGHLGWPCRYGSCVMSLPPGFGGKLWTEFYSAAAAHMVKASIYGDQMVIEKLKPDAAILQDLLPDDYFLGYRDLDVVKPADTALVIFAGKSKPHNCDVPWVKAAWTR